MSLPRDVAVVQLLMFHVSPDPDLPECICSLCRRPFADPEFLEQGVEPDDLNTMEEGDQSFPIRMWPERGEGKKYEIRFHPACLETVAVPDSGSSKFAWRPGLQVQWAWGDDERGRLLVKAAVTP